MQVSKDRFDFIKLKTNKDKYLATMINGERYTLNDANKLVNKTAEKKKVKIMPLRNTIIWQLKQSKSNK